MNPQQADTLVKNIDEGVKLILFVIRKRLGHCASYPLVLNAQHALAADTIIEASKTSTITMELVHSLVYGLFSEEVVSHEDLALNHPIERFLPLFARHHSGDGWRPLPDFSSALARASSGMRVRRLFTMRACTAPSTRMVVMGTCFALIWVVTRY